MRRVALIGAAGLFGLGLGLGGASLAIAESRGPRFLEPAPAAGYTPTKYRDTKRAYRTEAVRKKRKAQRAARKAERRGRK